MTAEYKIRITEAPSGAWFVEVITPDGSIVKCKSGLFSDDEAVDVGAELLKHHMSEWRITHGVAKPVRPHGSKVIKGEVD